MPLINTNVVLTWWLLITQFFNAACQWTSFTVDNWYREIKLLHQDTWSSTIKSYYYTQSYLYPSWIGEPRLAKLLPNPFLGHFQKMGQGNVWELGRNPFLLFYLCHLHRFRVLWFCNCYWDQIVELFKIRISTY